MTLKTRLILLIAFAVMALGILGAVAVVSARDSAQRLARLYETELAPTLALNSINTSFQATRSRMLGVTLGTYSPTGARLWLADERRNIDAQWQRFMAAYRINHGHIDAEHQHLVEQIDAYLPEAWRLFDAIYRAAEADDPAVLTVLLGERWAELHLRAIKPVDRLVPVYERAMVQAYEEGKRAARDEELVVWVALGITLLGLLAGMTWIIRRITRGVHTIRDGLARLAGNRYDTRIVVTGRDEIARMVAALNTTAGRLAQDRAEILALKNRNELILQSMGEGLYGTDNAGNITYINAAGAALTGWPAAELVGKPAHTTLHHTYRDGSAHPLADCPLHISLGDGRRHESDEDVFWRRDGTPFDVRIISTPIVEADRATGAVVVFADITAARQVQQALRASLEQLRAANRKLEETQSQLIQSEKLASIGQLAAGMAHEINNPIGFVNSNLGTLEKYSDSLLRLIDLYASAATQPGDAQSMAQIEALRQALDIDYLKEDLPTLLQESKAGLVRVQRIIRDLKDFSHIDAPEWQQVDLNASLDATLNVVWNEVKAKADVEKHYGALPLVECQAAQLNQVFMSLILNAVQALDERPERGALVLRSGYEDECCWVEVEDNGKGMSPEVQQHIFEPFFTTRPVGKGTGLGLSLAYGIVRKHGGRIDVDSASGRGTRMRIWLPLKQESTGNA